MGSCERIHQVGAYRDGELAVPDRLSFEAHLAGCAACKAELAQLTAMSRLLTTAQAPDMPEGLVERLHENVPSVRERGVLKLAESLIAAAAVITVACGGWLWQGTSGSDSSGATDTAWQSAAVTLNVESVASDAQQLTQWMADGLALEKNNE